MRDWQPEFIALWQQGLAIREIAQRLGVPYGTVQSRAHRLQQQGKIQPRARGGAYPRQRALARQARAKVSTDTPGVSSGVSSGVSPDTQQM
jgi:transposase